MNFEEMLEQREVKLTGGKYSNFVQFHDELTEDIFFGHCVKAECEAVASIDHKTQLHFSTNDEDDGVFAIAVEVGNYQTLEQLLNDNPAIVARNEFMDSTLKSLFDITSLLNERGIYHE